MSKQKMPAKIMLGPLPSALISCARAKGTPNIITLAWVGVVNSLPPLISIAVVPNRHSHHIIEETREFVVNIPTIDQVELADGCGTLSGKQVDKFAHFGVTAVAGTLTHAPMIRECPISMECKVVQTLALGSHSLFIGEIVQVYVDSAVLDEQGTIDLHRCRLLGFCSGRYLAMEPLGSKPGFTRKP